MKRPSASTLGLLACLGLVSLLPQLGAALPGRSYYFRDFGMAFLPFRLFWLRELAAGRWAFWNPYIQEGAPVFPACYPIDLLQVLSPTAAAVSWLLTMHFPLAALAAYALARGLGVSNGASLATGAAYALGGLAIASLNLYVFLQALAVAPLVALGLYLAAVRGGRAIPLASLGVAVALTTAAEFTAQALLLGLALGLVWPSAVSLRQATPRLLLALILGAGLAAVPLFLVVGVLPETLRGAGFSKDVALDYSLHPVVLLQVLVRDAFGSLSYPLEVWWGHRFFTRGFPYFVSLYLGPQVLALAVAGLAALNKRRRTLLLGVGGLGLWYALGRWGGLAPALVSLPLLRSLRFPSKAFLLPHTVLCLLAGFGADQLRRGASWRAYASGTGFCAALGLGVAVVARLAPNVIADFMWSAPAGNAILADFLGWDAFLSGAVGLIGVALAVAVVRGHTPAQRAVALLSVLLAADLVRAGSGVNPQVSPAFFELLPELKAERLDKLDGGRIFTYGTEHSPSVAAFLKRWQAGDILRAYFVKRQTLVSHVNLLDGVENAVSDDPGGFLLTPPALGPGDYDPRRVGTVLGRLRSASVSRILSLDPLSHPDLVLRAEAPTGAGDLKIRVYELRDPWPRAYLACRVFEVRDAEEARKQVDVSGFDPARHVVLEQSGEAACSQGSVRRGASVPGREEFEVDSDGTGYLVTRDTFARGWQASVDGRPAKVLRANGRHRAVPVTAGRHLVVLSYRPPWLRAGLLTMGCACLVSVLLVARPALIAGEDGPPV